MKLNFKPLDQHIVVDFVFIMGPLIVFPKSLSQIMHPCDPTLTNHVRFTLFLNLIFKKVTLVDASFGQFTFSQLQFHRPFFYENKPNHYTY